MHKSGPCFTSCVVEASDQLCLEKVEIALWKSFMAKIRRVLTGERPTNLVARAYELWAAVQQVLGPELQPATIAEQDSGWCPLTCCLDHRSSYSGM